MRLGNGPPMQHRPGIADRHRVVLPSAVAFFTAATISAGVIVGPESIFTRSLRSLPPTLTCVPPISITSHIFSGHIFLASHFTCIIAPIMRFLLFLVLAAAAFAQESIDRVVEKARKTFDVPGIGVAVVKDGQVVFAKGFGVRKLGDPAPVTANTLFGIASNTKAFTAASIAMLVDEGKVHWTDRVIDYLPAFQMSDPYVTREMRVRDLLVHRSGLALGAGDLMFFPSLGFVQRRNREAAALRASRHQFPQRVRLRQRPLSRRRQADRGVSGKPWSDFVKQRIFSPLGMTNSKTSITDIKPGDDFATPHAPVDGVIAAIRPDVLDNNAPAGAIQSSVAEMSKWIMMQLNTGEIPGGKRLFSAAQSKEMWTEVTPIPINDPPPQLARIEDEFLLLRARLVGQRLSRLQTGVAHRRTVRHGFARHHGSRPQARRDRA